MGQLEMGAVILHDVGRGLGRSEGSLLERLHRVPAPGEKSILPLLLLSLGQSIFEVVSQVRMTKRIATGCAISDNETVQGPACLVKIPRRQYCQMQYIFLIERPQRIGQHIQECLDVLLLER